MSIQTNCPACGAQISVEESSGTVTCPYCSTKFEVNMDGVQPAFKAADNEPEAAPEMQAIEPATQPEESYNASAAPGEPPLTGEVIPPMFGNRPQGGIFSGRWWLIVGVAVAGAFCLSCACMALLIQRIFH
jgi:hypothetical protein